MYGMTSQIDRLGVLPNTNDFLLHCRPKEKRWLKACIHKTFEICSISDIMMVNNKQMYGLYLLRKAEMELECKVEERLLYHVTSRENAMASLEEGLDWRRTKRAKYGKGVSFSDDANYANYFAAKDSGGSRAILVCSVLIGNIYRLKPLANKHDVHNIEYPPDGYDTTLSSTERVYVKYNDFEFYPMYVVFYITPSLNKCRLLKEQNRDMYIRPIRWSNREFHKTLAKSDKSNFYEDCVAKFVIIGLVVYFVLTHYEYLT